MRRVALLAIVAVTSLTLSTAAQQPTAPQVAASLQDKYNQIRDFSADFVQEYESGVLKRKITERGSVQVKKPGKMRWDYAPPAKKVFVSDGTSLFLFEPADNQVTKSAIPKQDEATTAVLFLVGKGNLTRDLNVTFLPDTPAGMYGLRLEPKLPERDYDWLQLLVDQKTMQIRTLTSADRQGGQSKFIFSNFKENTGLPDSTFDFKIPRGANVVTTDKSTR